MADEAVSDMRSFLVAIVIWLACCSGAVAQQNCPATPAAGTSNTTCANTAFVQKQLAAGGYVVGPGSATDGDVALFNGATGKLIKDSGFAFGPTGSKTIQAYGAKCNVIQVASASVSISSVTNPTNLTVTGASFSGATDVGKVISVPNAGTTVSSIKGTLITTIASVTDATHVVLAASATTTVSAVAETVSYGTDDTVALRAAATDASFSTVDLTTIAAPCMITDTVTQSIPKIWLGRGNAGGIIIFRQLAGTTAKSAFNLVSGCNWSQVKGITLDWDAGGNITSNTRVAAFAFACSNFISDGFNIQGNKATSVQGVGVCIWNTATTNTVIIQNGIFIACADYPINVGNASSHILIRKNQVIAGGPGTTNSGEISLLSTIAAFSDISIEDNLIDTSDLTTVTANTGINVEGGLGALACTHVNITGNRVIGVSGDTNTAHTGIAAFQCNDVHIEHNTASFFGECIGTATDVGVSIIGNTLESCGFEALENNTCTQCTVISNVANAPGTNGFENEGCVVCAYIGNTVNGFGTASTAVALDFPCPGTAAAPCIDQTIEGNIINFPTGGAGTGVTVSSANTTQGTGNAIIVANKIGSDGTAGSVGIKVNKTSTGAVSGFQFGPNGLRAPATGVLVSVGVAGPLCYTVGMNNSATAFTNNGAASGCN